MLFEIQVCLVDITHAPTLKCFEYVPSFFMLVHKTFCRTCLCDPSVLYCVSGFSLSVFNSKNERVSDCENKQDIGSLSNHSEMWSQHYQIGRALGVPIIFYSWSVTPGHFEALFRKQAAVMVINNKRQQKVNAFIMKYSFI